MSNLLNKIKQNIIENVKKICDNVINGIIIILG